MGRDEAAAPTTADAASSAAPASTATEETGAGSSAAAEATTAASSAEEATSAAADAPKTGGTLRMATPGAGAKETVHPFKGTTPADVNRRLQLWDPLFAAASASRPYEPYLAESATPNDDGTVWTIKLREGVVDHAGNPLTADDAIFSLQAVADVEDGAYGSPFASFMDVKTGFKKVDDLTFEMHLTKPLGDLGAVARDTSSIVAPRNWDADPKKPVGTPAVHVRLVHRRTAERVQAQPVVLDRGRPAVPSTSSRSSRSRTARRATNALLQGEVDAVENFDFLQAKNLQDDEERIRLLNAALDRGRCRSSCQFNMGPVQGRQGPVFQAVNLRSTSQAHGRRGVASASA